MYFLFSLLGIKDFYMFRALLAHPQEVPHKRHLEYCARVMSVGFTSTGDELQSAGALTPYPGDYNHCRICTPASEDGLKESPKHVRKK
jgi:hypothetical protein